MTMRTILFPVMHLFISFLCHAKQRELYSRLVSLARICHQGNCLKQTGNEQEVQGLLSLPVMETVFSTRQNMTRV